MAKKLKNLLTLALLCTYAMPDGHARSISWHMGAGAGWSWLNADTHISLTDSVITINPSSESKHTDSSGATGRLFLGYTAYGQNSFFSFGIGGSFSNLTHELTHHASHNAPPIDLSFRTKLKKDWGIDLFIKWGWARPLFQPYIKLGYTLNYLTSAYKDLSDNTSKEYTMSGKVGGGCLGGGVQLPLSNRVRLFVEYTWVFLQDVTFTLNPINTITFTHKVANASTHNLGLGVMLTF